MSKISYGPQSIESKLTNLLKPLFQGSKQEFLIINNLVKNWGEIVGKKYEKLCYPKSVNFTKNSKINSSQGKLTIAVYNSTTGFFLENNSEYLLERIAQLYGYKAIHKIIIKQEPKEIKASQAYEIQLPQEKEKLLQMQIKDVEDKDLAETLARLGRDIMNKKSS